MAQDETPKPPEFPPAEPFSEGAPVDPNRVTEWIAPSRRPSGTGGVRSGAASPHVGDLSGTVVEDYQVEAYLGAGGMGQVYKAFDTKLKRPVALKFLRTDDPVSVARLLREAQAQAGIQHENVCQVHAVGERDGKPYIAMQYIEGVPLLEASRGMSADERVRVLKDAASGLAEAHRMGVIHRDIKPGNILVERLSDGTYKPYLLDFGLAREDTDPRLTTTGEIMGTPLYMAPEQARGDFEAMDPRTDIYGFGATMYEVLSGKPLFESTRPAELLVQVLSQEPVTLRKVDRKIPQDLETITMKCLDKDPRRRYANAGELAEEIGRYLANEPIRARRTSWLYRLAKRVRKHKAAAAVAAVSLLLVLGLGGAWGYTRWQDSRRERLLGDYRQELDYVKTRLAYIRTQPVHDVRKEEAELRRRLDGIERTMAASGRYARGPCSWALGQGALLFGDPERAKKYLDDAWGRYKMRTPEVAFSLGLTYASLYENSLNELSQESDAASREKKAREAERTWRDPALLYLEKGRGLLAESPDFLEAKLAFLAGDLAGATQKIQESIRKAPWFYDAKILMSAIHRAEARGVLAGDNPKEALGMYLKAEQALLSASGQAPSDERLYLELADICTDASQAAYYQMASDPYAWIERGAAYASRAAVVDPSDPRPDYRLALAHFQRAECLSFSGKDPLDALHQCTDAGRRALAKDPSSIEGYIILGASAQLRAGFESDHGRDATPFIEEAIRNLTLGAQIDPDNVSIFVQLGNALFTRGKQASAKGEEARASFLNAAANYERALKYNRNEPLICSNRGYALCKAGEENLRLGLDPRADLAASLESFSAALRGSPGLILARMGGASAHETLGRYQHATGGDPSAEYRIAIRDYEASAASYADKLSLLRRESVVLARLADYQLESGQDPGETLEAMRKLASERMAMLEGGKPYSLALEGLAELKAAEWALSREASPDPHIAAARKYLQEALKENPKLTPARVNLAKAERIRAEWALSRKSPAGTVIRQGLSILEPLLAENPHDLSALSNRGALRLLAAKAARAPAEKKRWAEGAVADLGQVLSRDATYRRQCAPLLEEAKGLM